ncbi:MAG TPA: MmcQ/YjbR family DNA-binding protein [Candidatus Dormibacteraeota bacterium]|nr:MmcQ/YjbR family DNA-binding protein [Candidatus Dormibacteraeota bacterium]
MPEAEEIETWGEATFRVRGRIFAMGSDEGTHVSIKASLDDQAGLIEMDPKTFQVAAYTGRFGWVTVRLSRVGRQLGERLVTNAWEQTAPRRLSAKTRAGDNPRDRRTAGRSGAGSRRR